MADQRFPKEFRLRKRPDFLTVQRRGRRLKLPSVVVCWLPGAEAPRSRYGLTVSRKVGDAVTRNRVKRWLREAIRRSEARVEGLDVVFIARPSAAHAGAASLERQVARAFGQLRRAARRPQAPTGRP